MLNKHAKLNAIRVSALIFLFSHDTCIRTGFARPATDTADLSRPYRPRVYHHLSSIAVLALSSSVAPVSNQMECEQEKFLINFSDKSASVFSEFMLRIAKFEELVDTARQFLIGFHQELETFRRPQLNKTSRLVDHIIEANQTDRMKTYVDAGSRHRYDDIQNISKLHSYIRGLQDHLIKVKPLLDELESLKEEAIGIAKKVNHSAASDTCIDDEKVLNAEEDCIVESMHLQDKLTSYAALMAVVYNMFKLDYSMQETIINSISLTASKSEQLDSYCLMWNLRPYIDDNVMRQSWKLVN